MVAGDLETAFPMEVLGAKAEPEEAPYANAAAAVNGKIKSADDLNNNNNSTLLLIIEIRIPGHVTKVL